MVTRKAFTLMEIMVVVLIAAILVVASIPESEAMDTEAMREFSERFEADLNFARSLTIANPEDPTILKIDPAGNEYWLARQSASDVPITHPITQRPYVVSFGTESAAQGAMERIEILATNIGVDQTLKFDSNGTMEADTTITLRLKLGDSMFDVNVEPTTAQATLPDTPDATLSTGTGGILVAANGNVNENGNANANGNAHAAAQGNNNGNNNGNGGGAGGMLGP